MPDLSFLTFGELIISLVFILVLYFIVRYTRLEENFWENENERKKLQLKQGKVKLLE